MSIDKKLLSENFNSIKVRLKLPPQNEYNGGLRFQFHKGTIKTYETFYIL